LPVLAESTAIVDLNLTNTKTNKILEKNLREKIIGPENFNCDDREIYTLIVNDHEQKKLK
jgi:hypothetical protein